LLSWHRRVQILLTAAGATFAAWSLFEYVPMIGNGGAGFDTHAYWVAWKHSTMYGLPVGRWDAYLYTPAFAQGFWPLTLLPWPVVGIGWALLTTGLFVWLLAPTHWWIVVFVPMCAQAIIGGNVEAFYAVMLVFGFRWPGLWAFGALTKLTPFLGPVWFAARGELERLAQAVLVTATIAGVSLLTVPDLWLQWWHFLVSTHADAVGGAGRLGAPGLVYRLPVALLLTVYAARANRPWLLPVALLLTLPSLGINSFAVLTAIPRLWQPQERRRHRDEYGVSEFLP
jgi:hypothetical protein